MDTKQNKELFATTIVFVLSFALFGIPIWWKTTEVYRYPIPHSECQQLLNEQVNHAIPVKLVIEDQELQQGFFWEELLRISADEQEVFSSPSFSFRWTMSSVSNDEKELITKFRTLSDLDSAFENSERYSQTGYRYGELTILILNKNYTKEAKYTVGCGRQGYILNRDDHKSLAKDVLWFARSMIHADRLKKLYTSPSSFKVDKIPDKDRMRYLRSSNNFDITFSIIVPEPQTVNVHWDIKNAIDVYMKTMLEELELISKTKVRSQVLFMTSLATNSRRNQQNETVLYPEDLPSLLNSIETKLGSDTSIYQNLNFVLYIPTQQQTPLRIYKSKNEPLLSNAFLIPQWGGFVVYNCPVPENCTLPHFIHLNVHSYMSRFLSQFRLLLGLPDKKEISDKNFEILTNAVIHKWEFDFLLRKNAQEYLSASIASLSSLSQLLKTIGNIVITDDIGQKIHFALLSTKESLKLLSEGDLLEGFKKAQSAFVVSDEAFFNPSLLALLYFPEDQKYAIYIPLFLPVSIPVIASLKFLYTYWRESKEKAKKD